MTAPDIGPPPGFAEILDELAESWTPTPDHDPDEGPFAGGPYSPIVTRAWRIASRAETETET